MKSDAVAGHELKSDAHTITGRLIERHRFFKVSLGSLSEVSACLDLGLAFSLITPMEATELKSLLALSYASIKRLP